MNAAPLMPLAEAVARLERAGNAREICLGARGFWVEPEGNRQSPDHVVDLTEVQPRNPRTNAWAALAAIDDWPDEPDRFAVELQMVSSAHPCPCCGYVTFTSPPGTYEICPVCYWEDDAVQLRWPTLRGGANGLSLVESQLAFAADGAMDPRFVKLVRPPQDDEPREATWRPIDTRSDPFEQVDDRDASWPEDLTTLYWWRPTYWRLT